MLELGHGPEKTGGIVLKRVPIIALVLLFATASTEAVAGTPDRNGPLATTNCGKGAGVGFGTMTYSPSAVWPPDHKLVDVTITFAAPDILTDPNDSSAQTKLIVTSINGQTTDSEDWVGVGTLARSDPSVSPGQRTATLTVRVRALPHASYSIAIECHAEGEAFVMGFDAAGSTTITVPVDTHP